MLYFCTHCDKNYLLKGLALHHSLMQTVGDGKFKLYWLCNDEEIHRTLLEMNLPNVDTFSLKSLENTFDELRIAKDNPPSKYGTQYSQYMWTLTPYFVYYLLNCVVKEEQKLIYVDADLYFYRSPQEILDVVGDKAAGIHTHRFTPPFNDEIDTGWYNVGCLVFNNNEIGRRVSETWKDWLLDTTNEFYEKYGTCGDQRYLNLFERLFGEENICVFDKDDVIRHNAPWCCNDIAEKEPLFYHFSHFTIKEDGNWSDSIEGEWKPAADKNVTPYYDNYFGVQKMLAEKYDIKFAK